MEHVISTKQFLDRARLEALLDRAALFERQEETGIPQLLQGKLLASVFYEPSTRTRFSFEAAMLRLGGQIIMTEAASHFSAVKKGESLEDTIRVLGGYADVIVLRHPEKGSAERASKVSPVPRINAGDGAGEHPTQALLDLFTIRKECGTVDGLSIACMGDLLYGRTVHSLLRLLGLYKVKISLHAPPELKLPEEYISELRENGITIEEREGMDGVENADVVYVTRVQRERFSSDEEYQKVKGSYVIDEDWLQKLKPQAVIMHPLPRIDELAPEVDKDPRAAYFRQEKNGVYVRMALLAHVLGVENG